MCVCVFVCVCGCVRARVRICLCVSMDVNNGEGTDCVGKIENQKLMYLLRMKVDVIAIRFSLSFIRNLRWLSKRAHIKHQLFSINTYFNFLKS